MIFPAPSRWALQPCLPDSISSTLTKKRAAARATSPPTASMSCTAADINRRALCFATRASWKAFCAVCSYPTATNSLPRTAGTDALTWLDICPADAATMIYCSNGCALVNGSSERNGLRSWTSWDTRSLQRRSVTVRRLASVIVRPCNTKATLTYSTTGNTDGSYPDLGKGGLPARGGW